MFLRLLRIAILTAGVCQAQDNGTALDSDAANGTNATGPTVFTTTRTTHTTTMTTTTMTTTLGAYSATVTIVFTLTVSDPATAVNDPDFIAGVRRAIAAASGVHESAVEVILSVARRLSANARRLPSGQVQVDATITTSAATITAANSLGASVVSSITATSNTVLATQIVNSVSAVGGQAYTVSVQSFNRPTGYAVAATSNAPQPGSVTGDPITQYGDKKVKFILPYGQLTLMIQSPDINVYAVPHPGEESDEQWLNQVSITNAAGVQLLQVNIKSDIAVFNRSRLPKDAFETMDVKLGPTLEPLRIMPGAQTMMNFGEKVHVTFGRVRSPHAHPEAPRREVVIVAAPYLHVAITSSSGREWYGINSPLSTKHGHLDLMFPSFNARKLKGLLPELWDLQPMSEASRSMISEEPEEADLAGDENVTESDVRGVPDGSLSCDEKLVACHA